MTSQRPNNVGRRRSRSSKFDTTVIGSDGLALFAHSDVLAASSATLRTQLHGDAPLTVHIDGISGHIWNFVLQFMYSGKTTPTNALEAEGILFAGEALDIPALVDIGRNFKDIRNNKECVEEDGGYATDIVDVEHRRHQSDSHQVISRDANNARPVSASKRKHLNQSNQSNYSCDPGSLVLNTELTDSVVRVPAISSISVQAECIDNPSYVTTINPSYVATTNSSYVSTINPSFVATTKPSYVATINPSYVATPTTSIIQVFPESSQVSCRKRRCPKTRRRKCCPTHCQLWRNGCCGIRRRRYNFKCPIPRGGFCCPDHYHCNSLRSCNKPYKCRTRSSETQTVRPQAESMTLVKGRSYIYPMDNQSRECMVALSSDLMVSPSPPVPSSSHASGSVQCARQSSTEIHTAPVGWFSWLMPAKSADEITSSSWKSPDGASLLRLRQGMYAEPQQSQECCQWLNPIPMPSQLYKCRSCGEVFQDINRLRIHIDREHGSQGSLVCYT